MTSLGDINGQPEDLPDDDPEVAEREGRWRELQVGDLPELDAYRDRPTPPRQ